MTYVKIENYIRVFVPINNVRKYIGQTNFNYGPYLLTLKDQHCDFKKYWNFVSEDVFYDTKDFINPWIKTQKNAGPEELTDIQEIKVFLLFNFPEDYPEEDLFYFRMKYGE